MNWGKTEILTELGEMVFAQTPVIVSASRSTDIPTFYADWFVERWKAGYVKWKNPFNGVPLYVSFKNTRVVVFWTKNPLPIMDKLHILDRYMYYFQFTVNSYAQDIEPNVPNKNDIIILSASHRKEIIMDDREAYTGDTQKLGTPTDHFPPTTRIPARPTKRIHPHTKGLGAVWVIAVVVMLILVLLLVPGGPGESLIVPPTPTFEPLQPRLHRKGANHAKTALPVFPGGDSRVSLMGAV